MPIAAVPSYLGTDFRASSPALRFGLLLPIWTTREDQEREVRERAQAGSREGQEIAALLERAGMDAAIHQLRQRRQRPLPGVWEKNDAGERAAWKQVAALTSSDKACMQGLVSRQSFLAANVAQGSLLRLDARAVAPFTTGLGNEHPLENGFAFLTPYGLSYLPGSGVKGVLRQAARELAGGEWGDAEGWSTEPLYPLRIDGKPVLGGHDRPVKLSAIEVLFGRETPSGESEHVRGTLGFWDVIPQIPGDRLMVEVMTPHQGHYYQEKAEAGSIDPHESGHPIPKSFLTVPPGSRFVFHVECDLVRLERLAPDLAAKGRWRVLLEAAFRHAFAWLGFGAKTAVGYGHMISASPGSSEHSNAVSARPTPQAGPSRELARWERVVLHLNPGSGELSVSHGGRTALARGRAADQLRASLPANLAEQLKRKRKLDLDAVEVEVHANQCTIMSLSPKA